MVKISRLRKTDKKKKLSRECHNDIFEGFKGVIWTKKKNFVIETLESLQITSFCISDKYLILNCQKKEKEKYNSKLIAPKKKNKD